MFVSLLRYRGILICDNIKDKIADKRKEWHDHIQWMDPYRIARKAAEYKPMGHREVGQPKRRREDDF
jgi:hypothetical protein